MERQEKDRITAIIADLEHDKKVFSVNVVLQRPYMIHLNEGTHLPYGVHHLSAWSEQQLNDNATYLIGHDGIKKIDRIHVNGSLEDSFLAIEFYKEKPHDLSAVLRAKQAYDELTHVLNGPIKAKIHNVPAKVDALNPNKYNYCIFLSSDSLKIDKVNIFEDPF